MNRDATSASHVLQIVTDDNSKNLPGLATVTDIREAVQFLKRYEEGVTIVQALDSLRRRVFDPRKLEAYDFWGIVVRNGDRIRLSDLGWEMARLRAPETQFFRRLLTQNRTYSLTLEWIQQQGLQLVSNVELSSFWRVSGLEGVQFTNDEQFESSAGSFLQLCHAAELGVVLVGRKGQPTRLYIHPDELSALVNAGGLTEVEPLPFQLFPQTEVNCIAGNFKSMRRQRVFISSSSGTGSIKRLLDILTLAAVDHEFVNIATDERPITDNLDQMKHYDSAIVIITAEACHRGEEFSPETLIQLGAAVMHFRTRLVLLLENGLSLPTSVRVPCHTFERDVSWDLAVQLLSFVKQMDECSSHYSSNSGQPATAPNVGSHQSAKSIVRLR